LSDAAWADGPPAHPFIRRSPGRRRPGTAFLDKYYLGDLGLRRALFGYRDADIGGLLDNVVYLELLRSGYQVKVGVLDHAEIDVVAERHGERLYAHVAYLLPSSDTIQREFGNLERIPDN
jgi:predicted AAA+ superfamily ATPase